MGYSKKNPNRGSEDMEFSGVSKKQPGEFSGVN